MNITHKLTLAVLTMLLAACEHPIGVDGDGDLFSATGLRDCSAEAELCENTVNEAYRETYLAWPRSGSMFSGWEGCGSEGSYICKWSVPASAVQRFQGRTMPAMIASFSPLSEHFLSGVWTGSYAVNDEEQTGQAICLISSTLLLSCYLLPDLDEGNPSSLIAGNLLPIDNVDWTVFARFFSPPWAVAEDEAELIESANGMLESDCINEQCNNINFVLSVDEQNSITVDLSPDAALSQVDTSAENLAGSYLITDPQGSNAILTVDESFAVSLDSDNCSGSGQLTVVEPGSNVLALDLTVTCGDVSQRALGLTSLIKGGVDSEFGGRALFTGVANNQQFTQANDSISESVEVNISSEGSVQANSVFTGFDAELSVDGLNSTSWFSAGPGIGDAVYTWTGDRTDLISQITIFGNGGHANPDFRTGFGFGSVTLEVLKEGEVVYTRQSGLGGTPDPNVVYTVNQAGDQVRLTFQGHEDASCGGFSELRILALR